jgi:hypothetical protein
MCSLIQFPGFHGIEVGIGLFLVAWPLAWFMLWPRREIVWFKKLVSNHNFDFEPPGEKGTFEKLLGHYLDIAKVVIGLASGSIVLLVPMTRSYTARGMRMLR